MVSSFISRIVILIFGTLYPAYASYKAVRTKNVKEYVKWMMYWIVFALFTCAESFTDMFLSFWFPFYYELKIITVIYLLSPATKGSSILYRKFVHPLLIKREQEIDEYIAKAKEQGYHTMLNLGSKGVTYATSLIMQTAIKGGGGLVNQLRKSHSLSDLNEEQTLRRITREPRDDVDYFYSGDGRPNFYKTVQNQGPIVTSPGSSNLDFQELHHFQRPDDEMNYGQIPSTGELGSTYPSGVPMYYGMHSKGDRLVRTASLGPSSRIRTRAVTKNELPKTSSEGGSSWSTMESIEMKSLNEFDRRLSFPLTHCASFPLPFLSLQRGLVPEYQQLLANSAQNQMFTFINYPPSQIFNNQIINPETLETSTEKEGDSTPEPNPKSSFYDKEDFEENSLKMNDLEDNKEKVLDVDKYDNTTEKLSGNKVESESAVVSDVSLTSDASTVGERTGKYKKKPAPTPPSDVAYSRVSLSVSEENNEEEFYTPNSSPKLHRKNSVQNVDIMTEKSHENIVKTPTSDMGETKRKGKNKIRKNDFNIPKKLHMPKFSFWHQKGGKQSVSENSSVKSLEIATSEPKDQSELVQFIPLTDDDNTKSEH